MSVTMSVDVIGVNIRSTQPTGAGVKVGGSAPAVAAGTAATLASKKRWSADASMSDDGGAASRPSSSSNDRQRRRGCDCSASTRVVQKAERFRRKSSMYWRRSARHAATVNGSAAGPDRRIVLHNGRTARFAVRHSSSNQTPDGRRRQVTRRAGTCWSSSSVMVLSYSDARASPSR